MQMENAKDGLKVEREGREGSVTMEENTMVERNFLELPQTAGFRGFDELDKEEIAETEKRD